MEMRTLMTLTEAWVNQSIVEDIQAIEPDVAAKLEAGGFDTRFPLYHGSDAEFAAFDRSFARTADHIYTSPDRDTAGFYGKHLYLVVGRKGKQADLTDDWQLIGRLAETFKDEFYDAVRPDEELADLVQDLRDAIEPDEDGYADSDIEDDPRYVELRDRLARQYAADSITSGTMYNDVGRTFQDNVLNECFSEGFTSVFFHDKSSTGAWESIVFDKASDVMIVKRLV